RAVTAAREDFQQAAGRLAGFESAAKMRENRLSRIAQELESWTRRGESARAQLDILKGRQQDIEAQLAALAATPDAFAAQRDALEEQIAEGERARKAAADALSRGETEFREADRALRLAGEGLAGVRAELARVEERLKGNIAQRHQIERLIHETLSIPAERTAEVAGIRPEDPLPQEAASEQRVERLKAERERLGGVNLMAEEEARETQERRDQMVADREDLIAAIAKLRTGIS